MCFRCFLPASGASGSLWLRPGSLHDASKVDRVVGPIAEGLLARSAAATQRDTPPASEIDGAAFGVNDFEVSLDPKTSVMTYRNAASGHGFQSLRGRETSPQLILKSHPLLTYRHKM